MIWDHEAAGSSPACSTTYSLFTIHLTPAPRKDGAVVGGIPLPAPRQNNALRRRERRCRCKNQRGWAREFLTVFDLEKRDALQRL